MLTLVSPLAGWLGPLSEVPDTVFAGGMIGDGVAIDPTGASLHAPCAATIVAIHAARHAVTLRTDNGAELLLHLGIDSVALAGRGFTVHIVNGSRVAAGDALISVDLDLVASDVTSLMSPIIVTNGDDFAISRRAVPGSIRVGDWLMDLVQLRDAKERAEAIALDNETVDLSIVIRIVHGLHARPAAAVANTAKRFAAVVELRSDKARANAKSTVAIMALGLVCGDAAIISARGAGAAAAVAELAAVLDGLADVDDVVVSVTMPVIPLPAKSRQRPLPIIQSVEAIRGVTAAGGLAIGTTIRIDTAMLTPPTMGQGESIEAARLDGAVSIVRAALAARAAEGPSAAAAIVAAHLEVLDDPDIAARARAAIAAGASAGAAWRSALAEPIAALSAVADPRIAARAADLRDLDAQVVAATLGASISVPVLPEGAIIIAHDLLPSQLMALDTSRIAAIVTAAGGPTSHAAIIAAAMNLPAIVAAGPAVLGVANGLTVVVDADTATLTIAPSVADLAVAKARIDARHQYRAAARAAANVDCRMVDGTRIEVFANLGSQADSHSSSADEAGVAVAAGAEGCGLLRTELMFLHRTIPPGEDEQARAYQSIATALGGRPLIVRTLDVGGDKPVAYLQIPSEENPALGLRGIRVGLWQPELLRTQLRGILRVEPVGRCRILLPMIASLDELLAVRAMISEIAPGNIPKVGVMIETPAAAVTAELLAAHADFFAIGTNDLAQYTLAMDRGNPLLAGKIDSLHPAVLRLIAQAVAGAAVHLRPVGVCGGLASDLAAVPILIGLGVTELSAVPALVPEIKALVRTLTLAVCIDLAQQATALSSAREVRALRVAGMGGGVLS